MTAGELVKAVTSWAAGRADVVSVALVGSRARGDARLDSDVDFVIVCARPELYLQELTWISRFGVARAVSIEDWGNVQSVRAFYSGGPEAEYGITSTEWVSFPLDEGTVTVLQNGVIVLLDRDGSLTRAVESVFRNDSYT